MFLVITALCALFAAAVGACGGQFISEVFRTKGGSGFVANKSGLCCTIAAVVGLVGGGIFGGFGAAVLAALAGAGLANFVRNKIFFS
jgi:hypothetical protein